ncbi:hypothetical protein [Tenacibaculum phage Larrie]|nr:hypothetical protein [Tenacibaculum phage Larrie]
MGYKTTLTKPESRINWNESNLLINKDIGVIVITNGVHRTKFFEGTAIAENDSDVEVGSFFDDWIKDNFKKFVGKLEFEQYI